MARAKTKERASTAGDRARKPNTERVTVANDDIARRAYELYLARDCEHGHDMEDWLQAERELRRSISA